MVAQKIVKKEFTLKKLKTYNILTFMGYVSKHVHYLLCNCFTGRPLAF